MAKAEQPSEFAALSEEERELLLRVVEVLRQGFHADRVIAVMLVIIAVGMLVELALSAGDRRVRGRRGLLQTA